jgi:hypothetical protein
MGVNASNVSAHGTEAKMKGQRRKTSEAGPQAPC